MAEFALRRLGHDVWPIDTVSFSNHPGYGTWRGRITPAAELAALVEGLAALGVLPRCRAVLSGYLGSEENGGTVLDAVEQVRAVRPASLYCCDPVDGRSGQRPLRRGLAGPLLPRPGTVFGRHRRPQPLRTGGAGGPAVARARRCPRRHAGAAGARAADSIRSPLLLPFARHCAPAQRLLGESCRRADSDGQSSRRDGGADRSEAIPRKARDLSFQQFPIYVQRLISLRPGLPRRAVDAYIVSRRARNASMPARSDIIFFSTDPLSRYHKASVI